MALLDDMKVALRVSGDAFDGEIQTLIDSATDDMLRVGIDPAYVTPEDASETPALVRSAITCYCKAHFGYDNDEASRFNASYRQIVCDLLNSTHNTAAESDDDTL